MSTTRPDGDRRHDAAPVIGYLSLTTAMFVVVTGAFSSPWSAATFSRAQFVGQYRNGVYAPRVLGRELVLGLDSALDELGLQHLFGALVPADGDLFAALAIVNGAAFLLLAVVVWRIVTAGFDRTASTTDGGSVTATGGTDLRPLLLSTALMTLAAMSLYVVTPYDLLALAVMMLALWVARSRRPFDLLCIPLLVAAVATRESALVALAGLVATSIVPRPPCRRVVVFGSAAAALTTYAVLRVATAGASATNGLALSTNLELGDYSTLGVVVAALVLVAWWAVLVVVGLAPLPTSPADHVPAWRAPSAVIRLMWLLTSPYWVTSLLTGFWFEGLRLLLPLLFVDAWVRLTLAEAGPPSSLEVARTD